jgi:hypothetical protein
VSLENDKVNKPRTGRGIGVPVIACALDPAKLEERKGALWGILGRATERVATADGYQFSFDGETVSLKELTDVISLEQKCCPFLRFVLTVEPGDGPLRLQLSGPDGTKEFFASLWPNR